MTMTAISIFMCRVRLSDSLSQQRDSRAHPDWHPNEMWRNNGDGTFTDVTGAIGFDRVHRQSTVLGVCWYRLQQRPGGRPGRPTGEKPAIFENPREGKFPAREAMGLCQMADSTVAVLPCSISTTMVGWTSLSPTDAAPGTHALAQ